MAIKTASTGQFVIPTSPAVGVTCSSGAANTYTTAYVQQLASTAAAIYIIGAGGSLSTIAKPTYAHIQIATGSAGAEVIVGQIPGCQYSAIVGTTGTNLIWYTPVTIPIPVPTATRIAIKTADSIGALPHVIQLYAINQANVVDAGINESVDLQTIKTQTVSAASAVTFQSSIHSSGAAVASVTGAVSSVTAAVTLPSIPANWITAAGVSSNAIATQPTGIASSVAGSVSSVTAAVTLPSIPANWITAAGVSSNAIATQATGIASSVTAAVTLPSIPANWVTAAGVSASAFAGQPVSSVTAAVTLPSIPTNWITATGVSASAFNGKGDWNLGKTGYSLTQSFPTNFSSLLISASGFIQVGTNNDKTGYSLTSYTAPDNSSITAIKTQTDKLTFTVPTKVDANMLSVFGSTLQGAGTQANPWGP